MNDLSNNLISFAEFELDKVQRRLFRNGESVVLSSKAFDLLSFLVANNGTIVSKEEILDAVWENSFVEESNLVVQISNLRKALGESKNAPRFLVTVPGKGYKFAAETEENTLIIETHSVSELTIEQSEIKSNDFILRKNQSSKLKFLPYAFGILVIIGIGWFWLKSLQLPPNKQIKLAKLTTSGRIVNLAMSYDGNFAVFSQKDENGESLWLRHLETGSEKKIVESRPINYLGLTLSPDNQFIYASVFSKNEADPVLEKIPLLGGLSQIIPNMDLSSAISISPDGKRFAFTDSNSRDKETVFGIANIDGSNSRILKQAKYDVRFYPIFQASPLAWSPVNDEVAVSVIEKKDGNSSAAILLINPNDGSESYLTEKRWTDMDNLAWIDEDKLAFVAKEEDDLPFQVWVISRKTVEVRQLTNGLQNYDWIAASKNKILVIQINALSSLRIADYQETDHSLKIREIFTASEYIDELDWGKNDEVIFASRRSGKGELWKIKSDGSNLRQLTQNANVNAGITVSQTDDSVIFSSKQSQIRGIWQVNANGGNLRRISEGGDKSPDVSSDGKIVFHRGMEYAEGIFLQENGETKLLKENCYFPAISPDGTKTACYFTDEADNKWKISVVANNSGQEIGKINLPVPIYERQIRWHPSGKYITQIYSAGENLQMILLPLNGDKPSIIKGLGKGLSSLAEWSADGKQFLYPLITETQDAVVLTNF